ncbi:hypothetical protein [Geobacillus thermoleovorans]|uniref:hypothetical protein n=1 Tax=Geobacillus thermoleovorans TaxID=33941 RepID=UPI002078C229|nr:hypothetical protein [Geobacillus thermoleovorans]
MDKKTIAHHFSFDRRLLGRLYWFPFLAYGLCVGWMVIFSVRSDEAFLPYTVIQGMAVPIAGWHLVFLYRHLYDEGAKEALLWHYRKAVVLDLLRYAVLHGGVHRSSCLGGYLDSWIAVSHRPRVDAPVSAVLVLPVDWPCLVRRLWQPGCRLVDHRGLYVYGSRDARDVHAVAASVFVSSAGRLVVPPSPHDVAGGGHCDRRHFDWTGVLVNELEAIG